MFGLSVLNFLWEVQKWLNFHILLKIIDHHTYGTQKQLLNGCLILAKSPKSENFNLESFQHRTLESDLDKIWAWFGVRKCSKTSWLFVSGSQKVIQTPLTTKPTFGLIKGNQNKNEIVVTLVEISIVLPEEISDQIFLKIIKEDYSFPTHFESGIYLISS